MLPFKDDNPTSTFPFITIAFIALNIFIFLLQLTSTADPRDQVYSFGAIPHFLVTFSSPQPINPIGTVFTSMFMHGSLLHIGTNMLFLWIFGKNIEDQLGIPAILDPLQVIVDLRQIISLFRIVTDLAGVEGRVTLVI